MQCGRRPSHLCFLLRHGVHAFPDGSLGFANAGESMRLLRNGSRRIDKLQPVLVSGSICEDELHRRVSLQAVPRARTQKVYGHPTLFPR